MIAQNILAAFVGLAVGVQAGPCKPSSVTTTTGTAPTDVTSITSIATSGEPTTTTTEAATTTTTGAELTYSCPGGFPADSTCDVKFNHIGGSVGRIVKQAYGEALTSLGNCVQACAANKDCDFFAFWPNTFCELWEGNYERNDNAPVPWSWYELSCFCVPETEATTTATEATTTTEAATTTTTVAIESCVDNEKNPLPADRVCNKRGTSNQNSNLEWLSTLYGTTSVSICRETCLDTVGCTTFHLEDGICSFYSGTLDGVDEVETLYVWWSMECFCDLSSTTTTGASIELTTSSAEPTSTTETAPATTTTTTPSYSCINNEKQPLPAGKPCNKAGNANQNSNLNVMYNRHDARTVSSCREACLNANGCSAFNLNPGSECWLYSGTLDGVIESESEYYWWSMDDCFCDESSTTTSGAAIELTTSSVEPTSTTETSPATTTTTAPGESCVNNEKNPAPSDKVCNKRGYYNGNSRTFLDSPAGVVTMESCRDACHENNQCTFFAVTPGQSCYIYAGTLGVEIDQQMPYIWYDMGCFCDLDEPEY